MHVWLSPHWTLAIALGHVRSILITCRGPCRAPARPGLIHPDRVIQVRAEPFVSMNEFERLKVAQIASVEVRDHGSLLIKRREAASKVYLLVKGRCSVFDFTEGMAAMWAQREVRT